MRPPWQHWMARAAALAGVLAPLAGSPYHRAAPAPALDGIIDDNHVAELARTVADQADHVSAVQLATWIRTRLPRLRVIDVRSASEFRAYHIPEAEHAPLEDLATARFTDDDTVVVYAETGAQGAQAWGLLRALGHHRVVVLRGGLRAWLDDVMSPTITADAPAEAQAAFVRVAELSRWFGGTPRRLTGHAAVAPEDVPVAVRRRGC